MNVFHPNPEPKVLTQILRAYPDLERKKRNKKNQTKPATNDQQPAEVLSPHKAYLKQVRHAIAEAFFPHSNFVMVFDCETTADVKNELRFGFAAVFGMPSYQQVALWERGRLTREQLDQPHRHYCFYHPDNLQDDEIELLTEWVARFNRDKPDNHPELQLMPVRTFVKRQFYYWVHKQRALCVGHNLPFDLSRLATSWGPGGKDFANGFRLVLCDCIERWKAAHPGEREDLQPEDCQFHPYVRIRKLGPKKAKIAFRIARQSNKNAAKPYSGEFVDTATLGRALLGPGDLTLDGLCRRAGVPAEDSKFDAGNHHGQPLCDPYVAYAFQDVRATFALFCRLREVYRQHGLRTSISKIQSEASLGKAYFKELGIPPFRQQHPDTDPRFYGIASQAYYGGRSEVMLRLLPKEVIMVDFTSEYPSVNALMKNQQLLLAERMERRNHTEWAKAFLQQLTPKALLDPENWPKLRTMVRLQPQGDCLPIRSRFAGPGQPPNIAVTPIFSQESTWYTLGDVCAAALINPDKVPVIEEAYELVPIGKVPTKPWKLFGDERYPIDLEKDDFFKTVIERRQEMKAELIKLRMLSAAERREVKQRIDYLESAEQGLKFLANATSYGVLAEFIEEDPYETPKPIELHVGEPWPRKAMTRQFEVPGKYYCGEIASFITGGGRLLLALLERLARDRGIRYALCDTDSMVFVRPDAMTRTNFQQHSEEIVACFNRLSPYREGIPLLKIEDVNYFDDDWEPLFILAVSSKRYALYNKRWRDDAGQWQEGIRLRKCTTHGLGSYINPPGYCSKLPVPYAKDDEPISTARWIDDLWTLAIRRAEARPLHDDTDMVLEEEMYDLLGDVPAISRETVSTWEVYERVKHIPAIRPFSFFVTLPGIEAWQIDTHIRRTGKVMEYDPAWLGVGYYAPFSTEINEIRAHLIRKDTHQTTPHAMTASLAEKVLHHFAHAEHKAYPPHGIGMLQRQPIEVESLVYCGKETQTLYSYSEDGETNGTTIVGSEEPQYFELREMEGIMCWIGKPCQTLLSLGLTREELCQELKISNKTLSNMLAGQSVSYAVAERYIRLWPKVMTKKNIESPFQLAELLYPETSAAEDIKMLMKQGWTVPKLAHKLAKTPRSVYFWLQGASCKGTVRLKIRELLWEQDNGFLNTIKDR